MFSVDLTWVIVLFFLTCLGFYFLLKKNREALTGEIKLLSSDLMEKNHRSFLDLAGALLDKYREGMKGEWEASHRSLEEVILPIRESLHKIQGYSAEMERRREGAYASLQEQLMAMVKSEHLLRKETSQLVEALRSPHIRGTWGQMHLRQVVELSGMQNHCDFFEQSHLQGDEKAYRPDLIVRLPGDRQIIIDAKTPLEPYLEALDLDDETLRRKKLNDYTGTLRKHIRDLSCKEYWKQFTPTPEYVILFLPAESFFSTALKNDPALLEFSVSQNIMIATPTTLIAMLRAIFYGWKQETLSKNAQEIAKIGRDLYERLQVMNGHWIRLGRSLSVSVDTFNQAISSLESRVMPSVRKLKEFGASSGEKDIDLAEEVLKAPRSLENL